MGARSRDVIDAAGARDLYMRGVVSLADVQRGRRLRDKLGLSGQTHNPLR
jgi:hypothetical protein